MIVHHLAFSRGTRILWLIEEIGMTYDIVRYPRDENFRAPPALQAVHPLGKAPVIEDDGLILGESAVILDYINTKYGEGRFAPPANDRAWFVHNEWLQYAESTAAMPIMVMKMAATNGGLSPGMERFFSPLLTRTLNHIARGVSDRRYLMGDDLMLADIQMVYLLEVAAGSGMLGAHPAVEAYLDRLNEHPALQKAIAIGGPMRPPPR
ncbi:MAG TPA: glutathione S-transferase [Burkholderiales bacterium]|nr:glutathione S-transferase [Betaproteobacteria bacterium]HQR51806.1 glutathione S-transferase [Burkholderiales bacterium]